MGELKKYLNKEERTHYLFMMNLFDRCEMLEEWYERGNLTKEERKAFKTATTWGMKGLNLIAQRLNDDTLTSLQKELRQSSIHLDMTYSLEVIRKKKSALLDAAYEENKEYFKLVELVLEKNCKGCSIYCDSCDIYKEFEAQCVPYSGNDDDEEYHNCKYSYK